MAAGTFTFGFRAQIMPFIKLLVNDFTLIIRHRIHFHIDMGFLDLTAKLLGKEAQLGIAVFLVVVDINQNVDSALKGGVDCTADNSIEGRQCLAIVADQNSIVIRIEVDDEAIVCFFDRNFDVFINAGEIITKLVKDEFFDIFHRIDVGTDGAFFFVIAGDDVLKILAGNTVFFSGCFQNLCNGTAGIVFHAFLFSACL